MDMAKVERVFLSEACVRFIADCERRNSVDTTAKYRLMVQELKDSVGNPEVRAVTVDDLSRYAESWDLAPITERKKLERLRALFKFFMERGWCRFNPAVGVKKPKVKFKQRMPFSPEEVEKILWATEIYPIKGIYSKDSRLRIRAFVELLLFTGLRIRDVTLFDYSAISDGRIIVSTQKTGKPVHLPLPDALLKRLEDLRKVVHNGRLFWSGDCNPKSAVGDWQRSLRRLFKLAGIKGHAHRFRTTMAVNLLEKGIPLESVAMILGNSVKVVERHYAPWIERRQTSLDEAVRKTWV